MRLVKVADVDPRRAEYLCACGARKVLWKSNVRPGHTQSCGCIRRQATALRSIQHGHSAGYEKTRTYNCWKSMRQRCVNPKSRSYPYYGGRGIRVCDRWNSFEAFLEDMGEMPDGMSLDRINVDGNYEPDNCRWATRTEQMNNRRNNRMVEFEGERLTLADWARRIGVKYHTLMARLDSGMSVERAFSTSGNMRWKDRFFPTNDASNALVRIA